MATTIKLKNSVTTTNTPSSLAQGEVAINITDKKVWVGNAATTPIQIAGAGTTGNAAGSNTQVQYNSSGSFAGSANFTFNGTTVTMANDASISGLTVGKGGGAVSTNTVVGYQAQNTSTSGTANTEIGYQAGYAGTSAGANTLVGYRTGYALTSGGDSTFIGYQAGLSATTSADNTALGSSALRDTTTGASNVAVGRLALAQNTTGPNNTAVGYQAMYSNTTGDTNVAVGYRANYSNTTGTNNVGVGKDAIYSVTTGVNNTAIGDAAGRGCTGNVSTFVGASAGIVATGSSNTFIGCSAGEAITSGANNTILGRYNGNQGGLDIRTASNYIVLSDGGGNPRAYWNGSGTSTFTANVNGDTAMYMINNGNSSPFGLQLTFQNATPNNTSQFFFLGNDSTNNKVVLYSNGTVTNRTGTYNAFSDINLKQDIVDAGSQWDDIKAVRVRKFRLKDDVAANPEAKPMIGVIAQELEQTSAGLIDDCEDRDGTVTKAVKYSILYMKAIKALQEAMARIETLEAKVQQLENK